MFFKVTGSVCGYEVSEILIVKSKADAYLGFQKEYASLLGVEESIVEVSEVRQIG